MKGTVQRVNPAVGASVNWQDMASALLFKLSAGQQIAVTSDDIAQLLAKYPGGPVIHHHATNSEIRLRLLTKEDAEKEGLV